KTVSFTPEFFPRFDNCRAVAHDAVRKDESASCSHPGQDNNDSQHDEGNHRDERDDPRLNVLARCERWNVRRIVAGGTKTPVSAAIKWEFEAKIEIHSAGKECGKSNDAPFAEIKWLKKDLLR